MLNILWSNESEKYSWVLVDSYYNPPFTGHMTQLPKANLGTPDKTQMQMTVTLQDVENMGDMFATWMVNINNTFFWYSVRAYQPPNVAHAGNRPYWEIASGIGQPAPKLPGVGRGDSNIGESAWRQPDTDNPGNPYDFSSITDHLPAGMKIYIEANAGGEDLDVTVTISDL